MTMTLPTAVNLHTSDWDVDARARGAFAGTGEAQFGVRGISSNTNLPITGSAPIFNNTQTSSSTGPLRGVYWEFLATGGYDVSSDTRVAVWTWSFFAANRIQITTAANDGFVFRLGTGSGSPPTNYRTWRIAGNDTVGGTSRDNNRSIVMDLNVSDHDTLIGTYDNTDVQCYGLGNVRFNIVGANTNATIVQRMFVFTTTKTSSDIPYFTGASDWDDLADLVDGADYTDKISDDWVKREGAVFTVSCPIRFGDNSTSTQFNDNGVAVFWPDSDTSADPRVHVTDQAFRVYAYLRNNAADTLTLSGSYNCGNSNPPWDLNLSNLSTITIDGASFTNTGQFDVGSSVTGAVTFTSCKEVSIEDTGADLDGSSFSSPLGSYLLVLNV